MTEPRIQDRNPARTAENWAKITGMKERKQRVLIEQRAKKQRKYER